MKKMLKDGMVVFLRNGSERVVFEGYLYKITSDRRNMECLNWIGYYNEDLTSKDGEEFDIIEVKYDGKTKEVK